MGTIDRMDGSDVSCGKLLFKRLSVVPDVIGKEYEEMIRWNEFLLWRNI